MKSTFDKEKITGAVIIGRNEGERLVRSLKSVIGVVQHVVYVDSGSTDDSLNVAEGFGVDVVKLDMSISFTAARARNAGFEHLYQCNSDVSYVQFIDGDCEIVDDWIKSAVNVLDNESQVGVVCGRRRERYPERSVFNQLCDLEWDTPVGEVCACGGDFMIRASVFKKVDGFNASLIAGEEPELCVRIRQMGWKIWRINKEMTLHDANITHFWQWWKRNVRGGYAFAEGASIHGRKPYRHWVKESFRIWLWGFFIPIIILITSFFVPNLLSLFIIYPVQVIRIAIKNGARQRLSWYYSLSLMLGKFPELQGQFQFLFYKLIKSKSKIIEYKA